MSPTAHATHDAAWISRHLPSSVSLNGVTAHYAVLAVMGPKSRDLLQKLTKTPLDNNSFPFATAQVMIYYICHMCIVVVPLTVILFALQTIDIGFATGVRALRITYVGELGWELHTPVEVKCDIFSFV